MSVLKDSIILGTAGAGAGYALGVHKTANLAQQAQNLESQLESLKKPIIDKFEQYGYKEGMDISAAAQKKVNQAYTEMRNHGLSVPQANSKKALQKVYEKAADYLTKMETTYKNEMEKLKKPIQELLENAKTTKVKYVKAGLAIGLGLVLLNQMRKALFGHKSQSK